jgi:LPXTG-site transpeptidase (sortase) family protein
MRAMIDVKFFASLRETLSMDETQIEASEGSTIRQIWDQVTSRDYPVNTLCAINMDYAKPDDVVSDGDEQSAIRTLNYRLAEIGANGFYDTPSCGPPVTDDDVEITINSASYNSGNYTATLNVNGGTALPDGTYRLFVCGTTTIYDLIGLPLNGGLSDTVIDFTAIPAQTQADPSTLPDTGFSMGRLASLPVQPVSKAYATTDMMLEIPSLAVSIPIVGVPQSDESWDVTWLGNSAGYLAGSAFPTWAGNTVLTGHVWDANNNPGPFAEIKDLQYGDLVQIQAWGMTYTYEVRESRLLFPGNVEKVMEHEEYDWVTLVTCEFFNPFNNSYIFRRMVKAVLVDVGP